MESSENNNLPVKTRQKPTVGMWVILVLFSIGWTVTAASFIAALAGKIDMDPKVQSFYTHFGWGTVWLFVGIGVNSIALIELFHFQKRAVKIFLLSLVLCILGTIGSCFDPSTREILRATPLALVLSLASSLVGIAISAAFWLYVRRLAKRDILK